ncbi:hypothetical protein N431DRAFT_494664 [Stipitochalara longipes BDJ]|nr:hypothetical protein N431DRAFT_494664 [Stipitochalara longipes BDJ]
MDIRLDEERGSKRGFGKNKGKRLDQLDADYKNLLKTRPWPNLVRSVCHPISVLENGNSANREQFEDYKLMSDRFNEKLDEQRNASAPIISIEDSSYVDGGEQGETTSILGSQATQEPAEAESVVSSVARGTKESEAESVAGNPVDYTGGRDTQTSMANFTAPNLHGYFEFAKSTLRQIVPGNSNTWQASQSALMSTSARSGDRRSSQILASNGNSKENSNNQENSSQELLSSWASDAPKAVVEASRKRKYDSRMNLTSSASKRAIYGPTISAGSKTKRRKFTKQPMPSQRKKTKRQPLAKLSRNNQQTASYLEHGSSGTIVVQVPDPDDRLVTKSTSKHRKKLTQAPAEVKAFVSW